MRSRASAVGPDEVVTLRDDVIPGAAGSSETPITVVRDYWDERPCNVRHSLSPVGTRKYFDEVEARKYFVEPHIPRFAEFERWQDGKVLEIGCGIGTDTINFARAGASVTAVDLSPKSLELARKRAEVLGFANQVRFVEADAERLSDFVPPEPYDLVYSFGVIHHTPHPERVIEQIRTHYARPGTTVKLMVYHRYSWKVLGILLSKGHGRLWKLDDLVAEYSEAQTGCPITYTYSHRQARRLLGEGFAVRKIEVDHIFPYRIEDYIDHRYRKVWYFRWLPPAAFHALERVAGWHMCITAEAVREGA